MDLEKISNGYYNKIEFERNVAVKNGVEIRNSVESRNMFVGHGRLNEHIDIRYKVNEITQEELEEIIGSDKCTSNIGKIDDAFEYLKNVRPFEYFMIKKICIYESEKVKTACVFWDKIIRKFVIEYNPKFISAMSLVTNKSYEIILSFILEHELLHVLRKHVVTEDKNEENHMLANAVQDMVINRYLEEIYGFHLKLGITDRIILNGRLKEQLSLNMVMTELKKYSIIKKYSKEPSVYKFNGDVKIMFYDRNVSSLIDEQTLYKALNSIVKKFFIELEPDDMFDEVLIEIDENSIQEISRVVDDSRNELKELAGEGEGCSLIKNIIDNIQRPIGYNKSTVNWKALLRKYIVRGLSSVEKYNINVPNARIEGQFGRDIDIPIPKRILFAIDVSGSMKIDDYIWALDEIDAIIKSIGIRNLIVDVVWWGTFVVEEEFRNYKEFKNRCKRKTPSLGGTDADIAIKSINEHKRDDLCFVFTDGMFKEPKTSHYKDIIWCVTSDGIVDRIPKNNKDKIVKAQ